MRLLLYTRENPQQVYQRPLESEWVRVRRRAGQEIAHLLLTERLLDPAGKAKLCLTHEWLDSSLDTPERALQAVRVEACTEAGDCRGGQRFSATDLAMGVARRTIQGMLQAEQVKPEDNVVFMVAGVPAEEEDRLDEIYRLPPVVDLGVRPEVVGAIEAALATQRCKECTKPACERRPAAISDRVRESIVAWHAEHSDDGTEVGGVLLGYVVQQGPGRTEVVITEQLGVVDEKATVLRWEMRGEQWDQVLRSLAERHASGDANLVICGSWHSHDLRAIGQAAGDSGTASETCEEGTVLLPSPDDLFLWDTNFGLPHHINTIFNPHAGELTVYRWQHGQPQHALPLWVEGIPQSFGANGKETG